MKLATLSAILGASLLAAPGCLDTGDSVSTESLASEHHGGGHNCPGPSPVMQVGDFDGSGTVDAADVEMISSYNEAGDYAAYFDMNADGQLNGRDVSIVARNLGQPATARDLQMAALWATTSPYRNVGNALAAGYEPFTPDLRGHGIHFANFDLIYSWGDRGFQPGAPEGLNYTADGELVAAFYYAPGAIDLADYGAPVPEDMFFQALPVPEPTFDGLMAHEWHQHIGPCFGGATSPVLGFDQCVTESQCLTPIAEGGYGGQLWSPQFHMLHVWMYEFNECGPFGGIDEDISVDAPMEPNHGACTLPDLVHCVVIGYHDDGSPMCADGSDGGGHDGH